LLRKKPQKLGDIKIISDINRIQQEGFTRRNLHANVNDFNQHL